MRLGGHQLGDRVRESGPGAHVKNGERVFAVEHAAAGEDDGDEVDAGVVQEGS